VCINYDTFNIVKVEVEIDGWGGRAWINILTYDAQVLLLRESTDTKYISVLVPGTYSYLNLC
jgi:hypothetical protein